MILVDISQIYFSAVNSVFFKEQLKRGEYKAPYILQSMTFRALLEIKKKFGAGRWGNTNDDIMICCDDRKYYWRKTIFPHYKVKRKAARDKSELDYNELHDMLQEILDSLEVNFRYKFARVHECEADDIIATYVIHNRNEEILIYSGDSDFNQLLRYNGVSQWSPMTQDFIKLTPQQIYEKFMTKLVKGDPKDSIPNILSPDDIFVDYGDDGKLARQKPINKKVLEEFFNKGKAACTPEQVEKFERNQLLLQFESIPKPITERILKAINSIEVQGDVNKIYKYFIDNGLTIMNDNINYF